MSKWKWYLVITDNGSIPVRATSEEHAIDMFCNVRGYLSHLPNMSASEICDEEAEKYYQKIR